MGVYTSTHGIATSLETPQPEYDEHVLDRVEADSLPEPYNYKDICKWKADNEQRFSVLQLTTTGAARSVLLKFEGLSTKRRAN